MMTSQSIIKLDVGGQLFQTTISTLSKYPGSMLSTMFSHTDSGLSPMPRTEAGHFFLDVNPKFFEIVLEWLRLGEIITNDPVLLKGTLSMANYFGLDKLFMELKAVEKRSILSSKRKCYPDTIHLQSGSTSIPSQKLNSLKLKKIKLTRVSESLICRYLNGEDIYLPMTYNNKSGCFDLDYVHDLINDTDLFRRIAKNAFEFLNSDSFHAAEEIKFKDRAGNIIDGINQMKGYLKMFGIYENTHYKVEEATVGRGPNSAIKFCFQWNEEFIMKYSDPD